MLHKAFLKPFIWICLTFPKINKQNLFETSAELLWLNHRSLLERESAVWAVISFFLNGYSNEDTFILRNLWEASMSQSRGRFHIHEMKRNSPFDACFNNIVGFSLFLNIVETALRRIDSVGKADEKVYLNYLSEFWITVIMCIKPISSNRNSKWHLSRNCRFDVREPFNEGIYGH